MGGNKGILAREEGGGKWRTEEPETVEEEVEGRVDFVCVCVCARARAGARARVWGGCARACV